jgi:hypothetical protein
MHAFWGEADAITRSTRLPHERAIDVARAALAAEMREQRVFEMAQAAPETRATRS